MTKPFPEPWEVIAALVFPYFAYKIWETHTDTVDGQTYTYYVVMDHTLPTYFRVVITLLIVVTVIYVVWQIIQAVTPAKDISSEVDDELSRLRSNRKRTKET